MAFWKIFKFEANNFATPAYDARVAEGQRAFAEARQLSAQGMGREAILDAMRTQHSVEFEAGRLAAHATQEMQEREQMESRRAAVRV